ncbi:hypothetical protein SDC9_197121 [bioreactor metagenome]|uniref:Uncharacterized protein n=1 Tax=bioreactor metagenome TaxID=1076179 RepID=A0A645IEF0_9ZZZZ
MAVSNDPNQQAKIASMKNDIGSKNLDNIQSAVGEALIRQNQINYGANNIAKAFGYR